MRQTINSWFWFHRFLLFALGVSKHFDLFHFARRFLFASQLLVAAGKPVTGFHIVRLRALGLFQRSNGLRRLPLFEKYASSQRQRLDRLRLLLQRRVDAQPGGVEIVLLLEQ